jgi:hypothetical protein
MSAEPIDAEFSEAGTALAVAETRPLSASTGVMPILTPAEARAQMVAYTELVNAVVLDVDYQEFKERGQTKRFKKKSAVKKLQTYFGFSVDVLDWRRVDLGDGHFAYEVKARAKSPNGRYVDALAACATTEERFDVKRYDDETEARYQGRQKKALARSTHDVLSTAETRATNRAAMNLIGAGEVTAEEIGSRRDAFQDDPQHEEPPRQQQRPPSQPLAQQARSERDPGTIKDATKEKLAKAFAVLQINTKAEIGALYDAVTNGRVTDGDAMDSLSNREGADLCKQLAGTVCEACGKKPLLEKHASIGDDPCPNDLSEEAAFKREGYAALRERGHGIEELPL